MTTNHEDFSDSGEDEMKIKPRRSLVGYMAKLISFFLGFFLVGFLVYNLLQGGNNPLTLLQEKFSRKEFSCSFFLSTWDTINFKDDSLGIVKYRRHAAFPFSLFEGQKLEVIFIDTSGKVSEKTFDTKSSSFCTSIREVQSFGEKETLSKWTKNMERSRKLIDKQGAL
ncbi:MAG: hypothetical protein IPN70_00315 [Candidatus Moraniibacteriota bacterium]|nr:MAG: hypothetical protein IPN70_00315 [Candidatus Moranbacteria bacterium]